MSKNSLIILIESILIVLLVGVVVFLVVSNKPERNILPAQEAAQKGLDYINKNFMGEDTKAVLKSVEEKNGVYAFHMKIGDRTFTSYVTKDGALLFPEGINLNPPKPKEFPKTKKPDVKLFVMSFCPFGNQAEEMLIPVVDLLKDKANFELHYIFYSNYASGYPKYCYDKENKYCSMHGIQELHQDIRELCVYKYQKDKFWDFVKEINDKATSQNVDSKWENIAKNLGIDVEKIKTCQQNEALNLLTQEMNLTSKEYPVQDPAMHNGEEKERILGSPTLVINGVIYDGKRSSEDFKKAICSAFKNPPKECETDLSSQQESSVQGSCK